jgi:hypothetical protein
VRLERLRQALHTHVVQHERSAQHKFN